MKQLLPILSCLLFLPLNLKASFLARNEAGNSWSYFELRQLDCDVEVFGLFYETTITFDIRLTERPNRAPEPGIYDVTWDFSLVDGAVITDCWIKPYASEGFIQAEITDLSSAEALYQQYPYSQPRVLLRHRYERNYNGEFYKRFQMRFSPVTLTQGPVIRIRYLLPCTQRYNARRLSIPFNEFNVYKRVGRTLRIRDHNNPDTKPRILAGYGHSTSWKLEDGFWSVDMRDDSYASTLLNIAPESPDRSYLNTFQSDQGQFYQLSVAPPLAPEDRNPNNILLAVDVTANSSYSSPSVNFEEAVKLSSTSRDSITMLYSAFVPEIYDTTFVPATPNAIQGMFDRLRQQTVPQINTLPHLLKEAVGVFNQQKKGGEIWLLTDAGAHSDPPETALEIISQTLSEAEHPIAFRIISNDLGYWPYFYLNGKTYYGNDYLYENLARLSWGSFVRLREYQPYDYIDAMLDAVCPTASAVEVDPVPSGGFSYSRFQFNQERVNFPITLPSYEIGLFDGVPPFTASFYGQVDGDLFNKDLVIEPVESQAGWSVTETFWYERYVQNLLLEPQSFSTISYIEDISVQKRILTPYSGLIIPGADGRMAFTRLSEETVTDVQAVREVTSAIAMPEKISLTAYPNPFNASTKLRFDLPDDPAFETIEIRIVNMLGQAIRSDELAVNPSQTSVEWLWDGRNNDGSAATSGVYVVLTRMGNLTQNVKISLVK